MLQEAKVISLSTREEIDAQRERVRMLGQRLMFSRFLYAGQELEAAAAGEYDPRWDIFVRNTLSPLATVLHLAKTRGWKLFPACLEDGSKKSYLAAKHAPGGLNWGMTNDLEQLRKNFSKKQWRDKVGVGVPTGADNEIFVIEGDTKKGHGVDGLASLEALQAKHGELPDTLMARSPTGSVHRYYKHPGGRIKSGALAGYEGIDIKGDGGMVIAPTTLRPGIGRYEWLNDLPIVDAPAWLLELVRDKAEPKSTSSGDPALDNLMEYAQDKYPPLTREELLTIARVLPNPDLPWESNDEVYGWNDFGMGFWSADPNDDGIKADGKAAFHEWSQKSSKYSEGKTDEKWKAYFGCPPTKINAGWLINRAKEADPDWRKAAREVPPSKSRLVIVRASDVAPEELHWIWEGHLLRGSQELMTGLPGLGKSQVQCALVACCTACLQWPDGAAALDEPVDVVMLTAEDSIAQGLVPRLIAAGADTKRVHIVKCIHRDKRDRQFLLGEDLLDLEMTIREIGNVGLITIDPITAYMGGKMDSHKTTEVRSQLGPLKDFAERLDVAISTVTHPAKNAGPRAIDHFIGSQAFIAAGRVGHGCFQEMESTDLTEKKPTGRMLFAHVKYSMSRKMPTLAYRLVADKEVAPNITPSRVVWDGEVDISADDAVAGANGKRDGSIKTDEQKRAAKFLLDILAKGPRFQAYVEEQGDQRGISKKVLRTVKDRLKVVSERKGFGPEGGWMWGLPPSVVVTK